MSYLDTYDQLAGMWATWTQTPVSHISPATPPSPSSDPASPSAFLVWGLKEDREQATFGGSTQVTGQLAVEIWVESGYPRRLAELVYLLLDHLRAHAGQVEAVQLLPRRSIGPFMGEDPSWVGIEVTTPYLGFEEEDE